MSKKPEDIEISKACAKALDDLEKLEVEFSVAEARFTDISGRMVFHLRESVKSTH